MRIPLLLTVFLTSLSVASDFVLIEPGVTFRGRGDDLQASFPLTVVAQYYSDNERPVHYAYVTKPFHVAKMEVTVAEFREFVEATGYVTEAEKSGKGIIGWDPSQYAEDEQAPDWRAPRYDFQQKPDFTWKNPGFPQADDHPVVGVSWNDAKTYCAWLSETRDGTYRLPTEAEWEMAARANSGKTHFYWGNAARGEIQRYANIADVDLERARKLAAMRHWAVDVENEPGDGFVHTAPVGRFQPNAFGLHDMAGNVLEWCEDYFRFNYYDHWDPPRDGPQPVAVDPVNRSEKESDVNELRTVRGGSWYLGPLSARSSARNFFEGNEATATIGFRVVREATAEEVARFSNPHDQHVANIAALQAFGARFSSLNRQAEIALPDRKALTPEYAGLAATIPGLHRIHRAQGQPWTQPTWDALTRAEGIRVLSIRGYGLADVDLTGFATKQREIESIDFSSTGLTDEHLEQLSTLTSLNNFYAGCRPGAVTDAGLRHLASNPDLTALQVYHSAVTGEFLDAFKGRPLWVLQVSRAQGNDFEGGWTRAGSETLVESLPRLTKLNLSDQQVVDADLEPLKGLERLAEFNLQGCANLTDAGIAKLATSLERLENLELSNTQAGEAFAYAVPRLHFLKRLRMESVGLSDPALEQISRSRTLRSLHLEWDIGAIPYSASGIGSLWRIPLLESLQIDAPLKLGPGIEDLASAPSLKQLTLHYGCLTKEFVALLPRISTLERISIRNANQQQMADWRAAISQVAPNLHVQ